MTGFHLCRGSSSVAADTSAVLVGSSSEVRSSALRRMVNLFSSSTPAALLRSQASR